MTARAIRIPPSTELFGIVWIGASNEIAHSATSDNGTIPQSRGKNNRDLDTDQTDIDYCSRLVDTALGWDSSPVELTWTDGKLWGGTISGVRQFHLTPALVCACDLADLGLSVGVIHNGDGGEGIAEYASGAGAGADAKTWFDSRIADAPSTFKMRALCMGMGFPDMQNGTDAGNVETNLNTIVNRYRDSSVEGAESFHAFFFSPHSVFSSTGDNPQDHYDTVVSQAQSWANSDPRNHYVKTQLVTQLNQDIISVAAPEFGVHWGPEETANRGGAMARAIYNTLTGASNR